MKSEGTSSASGPALPSSNPRHTPPPKQRLFKQPLRPPIISQIINEEKQFFRKKEPKATKPAAGNAGGGNKGGRKQGKKGGSKKKGPKKNTPKPVVKEDAEADAVMRPIPSLVASPPPSSPPSLYPSPPRLAKRSKTSGMFRFCEPSITTGFKSPIGARLTLFCCFYRLYGLCNGSVMLL